MLRARKDTDNRGRTSEFRIREHRKGFGSCSAQYAPSVFVLISVAMFQNETSFLSRPW
jgi:hypothetical protein